MFNFIIISSLSLAGSPGCKKAPPPPPPVKGSGGGTQTGPGQEGLITPGQGITGQVLETMDAGGYTYLKLRSSRGEIWAAVQQTTVAKGQRVSILRATAMKDFKSRSLKRTFPVIYFGQLGQPGQGPGAGMGAPRMGGNTAAAHKKRLGARAKFAKPIPKAPGANGRSVVELFAQRSSLAGKTVVVRGKVVKFTSKIMGKNWIHLQDGTGTATDFDLTVTTQATVKVGDEVLVEGTLKADVNIGAGYSYKVLIEKATVKPAP